MKKKREREPLDLAMDVESKLALFRDLFRSLGFARGGEPMELGRLGQYAMSEILRDMARNMKVIRTHIDEQSLRRAKEKRK